MPKQNRELGLRYRIAFLEVLTSDLQQRETIESWLESESILSGEARRGYQRLIETSAGVIPW